VYASRGSWGAAPKSTLDLGWVMLTGERSIGKIRY
jgi:hypothetical protein